MTEIIPIREEEVQKQETPQIDQSMRDEQFTRALIPPNTALVGRSIKFRDKFIVSGLVKVEEDDVTVANTTTETNLSSFLFFPNEWHAHMVVRVIGQGVYSTANAADTFSIRVGLGLAPTTAMATLTSAGATVTNAPWHFEFYGHVHAIGTSGLIAPSLSGDVNNSSRDSISASDTALDTTSSQTLAITIQWSNNLAGNTLTLRDLFIEILN